MILTPKPKSALKALLCGALALLFALPAPAQGKSDDVLLDMQQAFRKGDKKRLSALLPQARGHVLEPWAAYWELKARLGEASGQEVQDFLTRYAGTYQEDRMRNDWLQLLGQRRDWTNFAAEHPNYRMSDDREVRCYALLVDHLKNPVLDARLSDEVRKNWYAQRDADDGCTSAAERLVGSKNLAPLDVWKKARMATEANRPRAARDAVQIVAPEAVGLVTDLNANAAKVPVDQVPGAAHGAQGNHHAGADQAGHQRHGRRHRTAQGQVGAAAHRRRAKLDLGCDRQTGRQSPVRRRAGLLRQRHARHRPQR